MTNHEHPHADDEPTPREPVGPDREQLGPGEIDLTGSVPQDDSLRDVISDAIVEAHASGGEVPEWGARAIARYFANGSGDPGSSLHHFAVTGRAEANRIWHELAALYSAPTTSAEELEWIDWLSTYVINRLDPADAPVTGSALEKVSHYLQEAFRAADARGEAINRDDARAIAALLAPLLGTDSELARFAETGEGDHQQLLLECLALTGRPTATPVIRDQWIPRLEQYLARNPRRPDLEPASMEPESPTGPAAEGIRQHGDAFRAYLSLDDVDPSRDDLVQTFTEFYIGAFASMDDLLDELTEIRDWERAIAELAGQWGIDDLVSLDRSKVEHVARLTWDIVELNGLLYVFAK
ncbi:MAG: hypothetical protein ACTHOD_01465 [Motilibacteraceae bacterium]